MNKYLVPAKSSPETAKPISRKKRQWKRSLIELTGKLDPNYRHDLSFLLMRSYSQIGRFPHDYSVDDSPCETFMQMTYSAQYYDRMHHSPRFLFLPSDPFLFVQFCFLCLGNLYLSIFREAVSALEFDSKGIYLASVTKSSCLTIHEFEALYCHAKDAASKRPGSQDYESKIVLHMHFPKQLDAVRWNPANQDEVACTSTEDAEVLIFDIGYVSSQPAHVLRARKNVTISGSMIHKGLTDIAFSTSDESRLFASDTNGNVNIWDRREGVLPCLELSSNAHCNLNSIQLNVDNQTVFGAGRLGIINMWDLRGGRDSSAFQLHKEQACQPPVMSWKLDSMLKKIGPLKVHKMVSPTIRSLFQALPAQSNIVTREIHSIDLNLCCPNQLAFHLDNGWSGVFDIQNFKVTHVHCPPPAWLNSPNNTINDLCFRKPSWLHTYSMYAVGSSSSDGIHLLDFYPNVTSPCHVDYSENLKDLKRGRQNRFVSLDESVTVCAAHPLNTSIIVGTSKSSLILVSHNNRSLDAGAVDEYDGNDENG
ncbi:hypothetical protein LINPERPRIM_LOCUS11675 [Linum perenne]